jgi:Domain of Unknown Function (DUF1080)
VPKFFYPLSELVPDSLIPAELFQIADRSPLELVGIVDYRVQSMETGFSVAADLGLDPDAQGQPELLLALPHFPDLGLVLRALGRLEVTVEQQVTVRVSLGAFSLRLPPAVLKPVRARPDGGWEPDPDRDHVEVDVAYAASDGITSLHPLVITIDGNGRLDLDYPFENPDGAAIRPVASLNGPAMIGDTGIVVDVQRLSFNLDPADPWLAFDEAEVVLPSDLVGPLVLPKVRLENALLNRRGFSGHVAAIWPLAFDNGRFVYALDDGPQEATFFGLNGGLSQIGLSFADNQLTGSEIGGGLVIPYFDEPADVRLCIESSGDFTVTVTAQDDDGLTLRKEDLLELSIRSLSLAKDEETAALVVSGGIQPLLMAADGLQWPRVDVTDLSIDSTGRFSIREAWIDLKELGTLDLFGFHFQLSRIGLGSEDARDRLWVDLSGSLRLMEQIPVGLDVEGFRLSWPRNLDALLDPSVSLEQRALDVLGQLEVQFAGIYLLYGVPGAVEFEGLIRFIKQEQIVGFAGDVALRVPSTGLSAEAGLMIGMVFEPPPFPFLYVYLGVELPAGLPLGQSGLALKGALGLFGLNVAPDRTPEQNWYYDWYRRPPIVGAHPTNKWRPERSALALGVGLTITTVDGFIKGVRGLLVLAIPGPILIIEGRALVFNGLLPAEPPLRALAVFDGQAGTVQFNLDATAEIVEDMLEAWGGLEAFFDFNDLTNWHLYLGQDEPAEQRIQANIFKLADGRYLFSANAYVMLDMLGGVSPRTRLGAYVGMKQTFKDVEPFVIDLEAQIEGNGVLSLLPEQFSGELELSAGIKISAFGFGLQLAANADVLSEGPHPFKVDTTLTITADPPAPLPDFEAELHFAWTAAEVPAIAAPLVGLVADSDFAPGGGALHAFEAAQAANYAALAEQSPIVPMDARPTLMFGHDMNDASGGQFARDSAGQAYSWDVGRIKLAAYVVAVELHEHRKGVPWTGNAAQDWHLVATSIASAAASAPEPLWGIWLADAAPETPGAPAARRLRLWTANPFVHARPALGPGYPGVFGLGGPRPGYAEEFLRDYPDYLHCRDTTVSETCVDFTRAPEPKLTDGRQPQSLWDWRAEGITFVADNARFTRPVPGSPRTCLVATGVRLRFAEPVVRVRLRFCADPALGAADARALLTPRRIARADEERKKITEAARAAGQPPDFSTCAFDVSFSITIDGPTWTVETREGFECLGLRRPTPLESVCYATAEEVARAARSREQCATNDATVDHIGETGPVLQPGSYYRLRVTTRVDAELISGEGGFGGLLDTLYEEALKGLTGAGVGGSLPFEQHGFFQTEGPPTALARYVKWSTPPEQSMRVFRGDDFALRFRRPNLQQQFAHPPHVLEIVLRDVQGRLVSGYRSVWFKAAAATPLPDEETWLTHLAAAGQPQTLAADDVLEAQRVLAPGGGAVPTLLAPNVRYDLLVVGGEGGTLLLDGRFSPAALAAVWGAPSGGWSVVGTPGPDDEIVDGELCRDTGGPEELVAGDPSWTDYEMTVDARAAGNAAFGLVFRRLRQGSDATGVLSAFRLVLDRAQKQIRLEQLVDSGRTPLGAPFSVTTPDAVCSATTWSRFRVSAIGRRLRVWKEDQLVLDVTGDSPLQGQIGLFATGAGVAFRRLAVRDVALYRVGFTTSAFARFADLPQSFNGRAGDLPVTAWPATMWAAADQAGSEQARQTRDWARALIDFRDERLDREALETQRLALRAARAACDAAFRSLGDASGLPLLDPLPDRLEIHALRLSGGAATASIAGFWLRAPESLDLQRLVEGERVGRTQLRLQHQAPESSFFSTLDMLFVADADDRQVFLLPPSPSSSLSAAPWSIGRYHLTLTYQRDLGSPSDPHAERYAPAIEKHEGASANDVSHLTWQVD